MAELQLTVHCKTPVNRMGFLFMCLLFPLWALIVPTCLGLMSAYLMQYQVPAVIAFMLLAFLTAIPLGCLFLTAVFEDDRLNLSKERLSFPLFLLLAMHGKRDRNWSELSSASLEGSAHDGTGRLILNFGDKEQLCLQTKWFNKEELEQVLLSVELWGTNCTRTPALIGYQSELQNSNRGIGQGSYTQMWEEELSRRFNATSFVPLEPDHLLRSGKLKIVRQIAFGGLSAIYLAEREGQDLVVIKEAVVPGSSDPDTRRKAEELFQREAKLLVQLDHPQIAKVLDHFVDDGRNYLMIEYVNGQDLRQHIKQNGAQPQALVLDWAEQIAGILDYLHTRTPPILHRDLTPDNLVLRNDGTVKLIDFGAANEFVGTATGTLVGKQSYIAPEQLRGKANLSSDLYSFGGSLYYLLTGKDPVPLALSRPRNVLPEISEELDALVASLTAFEKSERPEGGEELLNRIKQLRAASSDRDVAPVGGSV